MSVPSVNFRQRNRPRRAPPRPRAAVERRPSRPQIGHNRSSSVERNKLALVAFSSSDSGSEDSLPKLQFASKSPASPAMLSSSSSGDEQPAAPAGANWASKTAPPANYQSRRDDRPQAQGQRPPKLPKPPPILLPDSDPIEPPPSPIRARASSLRPSLGSPLRREAGVFTHVVVQEQKKMVKRNGAEYRLMADERAIYFASSTKDGIGIAAKAIVPEVIPEFLAIVLIHGRGKRATIVSPPLEKPFDDRPAQLLGLSYVSLPDNRTKYRTFRLALPRDEAHYPITKAKELTRLAEGEGASAKFWRFANKLPAIAPDGRVISPFGNVYLVDSAKNFVVCNEDDEMIFMMYKSTERTFNVKGKAPFTPLTAFALSLAIIAK